jgi:hypothetical protein
MQINFVGMHTFSVNLKNNRERKTYQKLKFLLSQAASHSQQFISNGRSINLLLITFATLISNKIELKNLVFEVLETLTD